MPSDFRIYAPLSFFEKADAAEGQKRRIGGVISTETLDKQGEIVVQKGLDFGHFLSEGHFNDNHSKKTADVLGYPTGVTRFQKGERLPDGTVAKSNCTWAEGYLYETPEASRIWDLGRAMQKAGASRRLGYSIEGAVVERAEENKRVVKKAVVRNVAITNCPVGQDTRMEVLAKALTATSPGGEASAAEVGHAVSGTGAGFLLAHRSVEGVSPKENTGEEDEEPVTKAEALFLIKAQLGCDDATAAEVFDAIHTMKAHGAL